MKNEEKFGELTDTDARAISNALIYLDRGLTVGEVMDYLEKREKKAKEEKAKLLKDTLKKLKGRAWKMVNDEYKSVFRVDDIEIGERLGEFEPLMVGPRFTYMDGKSFRRNDMAGKDTDSTFYFNLKNSPYKITEITLEEFDELLNTHAKILGYVQP